MLSAIPNPFNSSTLICIDTGDSEPCDIEIYDMLGRRVKSENIADNSSGKLSYRWDGTDSNLTPLPSGVYFVRVNNNTASAKEKLVLLK